MNFISYAQNFEDVMLWRALKHIDIGFYIDVGAAWPDEHSVTKAFYERGWSGINIEPNPVFHQLLVEARRRDINLRLAVGDHEGQEIMNFMADTGLSTLDDAIAHQHLNAGWNLDRQKVTLSTISKIWDEYVPESQEVHFLKVDVEGLEEAVLRGNDWAAKRPWIVVVEATLPMSQVETHEFWEPILYGADYQFAYADGLNRFYLGREHLNLLPAFKYPPNVFDDFVLVAQHHAEVRSKQLEVRAQQLEVRACEAGTCAAEAKVHACTAEARAVEAEARASQAERRANEAEARAAAAEVYVNEATTCANEMRSKLTTVLDSRSWRLTTPLRACNPEFIGRSAIKRAGQWIMKHPRLVDVIKQRIEGHPKLWEKLKRQVLFTESTSAEDFTVILLDELEIYFSNGPTADLRGIGRVSRELLSQFLSLKKGLGDKKTEHQFRATKQIYFYSSIHWCPETLPQPSVVMIHDVIPLLFPHEFPDAILKEWNDRYKAIAGQARRIVTISNSSAEDITRTLGVSREKISVIHNGVTKLPIAEKPTVRVPNNPYLVFLGSHDHHKNVDVVLNALSLPEVVDVELVMIGDNKGCARRVSELGLGNRVHFLGRISDEESGYVIQHALALVFPSIYEGFGFPPLEAALLGTPSVCSKRPAMTELLDGAALFADPYSPHEWANAIRELRDDCQCRASIQSKAKTRASVYKWECAASIYKALFEGEVA